VSCHKKSTGKDPIVGRAVAWFNIEQAMYKINLTSLLPCGSSRQGLCGEGISEAEKETFLEHFGIDANAAQPSIWNGRTGKSKKKNKKTLCL